MRFLRKLIGICIHEYTYHKFRYVGHCQDYSVEFYQCDKCGHIHFIHMEDNLKPSTCS